MPPCRFPLFKVGCRNRRGPLIHHAHAPKKPARVVLLGGSGFIGRSLAGDLEREGIETLALSSAQMDLCAASAPQTLAEIVRQNDTLVVASAVTPDKGRDVRAQMKNFTMGLALFDFLEKKPCEHVVYLSSDAVYDDAASLVSETTPPSPGSFYGITHFGRERMLSDALKKSGAPYLVLRPSILYGAEDTHNSYGPNRFFRAAASSGKITLFGNGEEKRDHVYIRDVCRLIRECLLRKSRGVLNVATGRSVSFWDVAGKVRALFGNGVSVETTPRANPVTHRHYDITSCLRALPDFRYTSLEVGLAATFEKLRVSK